jgi:hypothetical protein
MDEQCAEYQKLLMEENQKSKEHYIAWRMPNFLPSFFFFFVFFECF